MDDIEVQGRDSLDAFGERLFEIKFSDLIPLEEGRRGFRAVVPMKLEGCMVSCKSVRKGDLRAKQILYHEAVVLSRIRHPHILNLIGICYENKFALVTDFCFGGTLTEMIAEDEINPHAGARIGIQVSSAVAYIHAKGYLHGAVTTQNISLLTDSIDAPFAKLTGFGKSRRFDGTLTSHPGVDVYDVCAVLIQMLAKNKREPPLLLPTFDPIVKNGYV